MTRPPIVPVALLLLAGPLLAGRAILPDVRADEFTEMRAEFRRAMKSEDWKDRRDAFIYLSDLDRAESVEEILDALEDEENGAVVLAGLEALGLQKSLSSREVLLEVARKGKGRQRLLVLRALARQKGPEVVDLLVEVADGRDEMAAAQAVLALGSEKPPAALPVLLDLARHGDWQLRRAAAMVLQEYGAKEAVEPLARALEDSEGRDRNDILRALTEITGQEFGYDPKAWRKYARGTDPEEIEAEPELVPTVFGVPIYGERVVICLDNSLRMTDPHPFDSKRLRELCDPKDGRPIPWFRMKTNGHFAHAHVMHLVEGLPKGAKLGLITFNAIVRDAFEGLASVGRATRMRAEETIESLVTDDGINSYGALDRALDIAGEGESRAWSKGPDEIVFVTVNMPTAGEIQEADVVAAAIGLKASLRLVPIHTVGIHYHPYDMCRQIAALTGGVYVNLTE